MKEYGDYYMITTLIPKSLVVELKQSYSTELPTEDELKNGITLAQLAYKAGYKACVDYIEACHELQKTDGRITNL